MMEISFQYLKAFASLCYRSKKVLNNPIYLTLDASSLCNMSCKMCFKNESFYQQPKDTILEPEIVEKIYSQVQPKIVLIGGVSGEPLTNKNMPLLVKIANEHKSKVITTTNGLLLSEQMSTDLIESGIHMIKISVDAATEETYEEIRQSKQFKKLINNIIRLGDIEEEKRNERKVIRLEYVIQKGNIHEIISFISLAKKLKISRINFKPIDFKAVSKETENEFKKKYNLKNIIDTLKNASIIATQEGIGHNISDELLLGISKIADIEDYDLKEDDYFFPWYKNTRGKNMFCVMPWLQMAIDIRGDISVCCAVFEPKLYEKDLLVGNIKYDDLRVLWNGERMQKIRKLFANRSNYQYEICRKCINKPYVWGEIKKNKLFLK